MSDLHGCAIDIGFLVEVLGPGFGFQLCISIRSKGGSGSRLIFLNFDPHPYPPVAAPMLHGGSGGMSDFGLSSLGKGDCAARGEPKEGQIPPTPEGHGVK